MKNLVFLLLLAVPLWHGCKERDELQPKKTEITFVGEAGGGYPKTEYLLWREKDGEYKESLTEFIPSGNVSKAIYAERGETVVGVISFIENGGQVKDYAKTQFIVNGKVVASEENMMAQVLEVKYVVP